MAETSVMQESPQIVGLRPQMRRTDIPPIKQNANPPTILVHLELLLCAQGGKIKELEGV